MEVTVQFSSKAEDESTQYIEILHQAFEHIIEDHNLNGYELSGIANYARQMCERMEDKARERKDVWR